MKRLGLLIPSSNIVLEPLSARLQARHPDINIHISRLGVLDVKLNAESRAQFELDAQVAAARLLCDASVERITWGGTSASWLGFARDKAFVERMALNVDVPVTTCVLDINHRLDELGAKRIGMVTPYTDDVALQINQNYEYMGYVIAASRNNGGYISNEFAKIKPDVIERMIREVADSAPDAIVIMCTNVAGADTAIQLEEELGIPILDSAAISLMTIL